MDSELLAEQLAELCEDGLDDLDEVSSVKKGLRLIFMSGDSFLLKIEQEEDEEEDEEDEEEEEDEDEDEEEDEN